MKKLVFLPLIVILLFACNPYNQDLINQINRRLDDLEYRLSQIERNTMNNQRDLQNLQKEISKINSDVAAAKQAINEQKSMPVVSQDDLKNILARITSLEMRYSQLSAALNVSDIRELIYRLGDVEVSQKQQQMAYERFVQQTTQLLEQVDAKQIISRLNSLENSVSSISNQLSQAVELTTRIRSIENTIERLASQTPQTQSFADLSFIETEIGQLRSALKETESSLRRDFQRLLESQPRPVAVGSSAELQQYVANTTALVRQLATELEALRGVVREYDRDRFLKLDQGYITYIVKSGDTLLGILQAYGLKQDKLRQVMELNQIQDANRLIVGQRIKIPIEDTSALFRYPLSAPLNPQEVVGVFSEPAGGGVRTGVDIKVTEERKVRSILPGRVTSIIQDQYGYHVRVDHGNGILAVYGNLSLIEVSQGQWLMAGQSIGTVETVFHFEIWIDGEPRDPLRILLKYAGKFEATYYSEWEDGKLPEHPTFRVTATGTTPKDWWTIAADPSVIPLGSIVYIPQFSNKPNYGFFKVEDTGLAIKNDKIDIYTSSLKEALVNMRSYVDVYVVASQIR
ncbi:peptidoglycan DD-metalloendopeptidase family protein [Pseudothermotoga sp. U03pept]|uniref:peptidoglycan DD-metalloendopeptidase family protein n=1 Tax=Pseudothermotoga sp. U03pept TaxID=3447012 RepID=UPI003F05B37E